MLTGNQLLKKKPLMQRLLEEKVTLPEPIWAKISWVWGYFFLGMGFLNMYFAYMYSTKVWVYFKVIGTTGLTLIFVIAQAFYLAKHIEPEQNAAEK